MDSAEQEHPAALAGQGVHDALKLPEGVAGDELGFAIAVRLEQLHVGYGLEADDLVAAGIIDDEVAGNGEEKGTSGRDILPTISGIGTSEALRHHVLQLMLGWRYSPEARAKRCLVGQNHRFEPLQLGANPIHFGPLSLVAAPLPSFLCM